MLFAELFPFLGLSFDDEVDQRASVEAERFIVGGGLPLGVTGFDQFGHDDVFESLFGNWFSHVKRRPPLARRFVP